MASRPHIVVNDYDIIKSIFITNCRAFYDHPKHTLDMYPLHHSMISVPGEKWKKVRQLSSPLFTTAKLLQTSTGLLEDSVRKMDCFLSTKGQQFETDICELAEGFAFDIMSRSSFDINGPVYDHDYELISAARDFFTNVPNVLIEVAGAFTPIQKLVAFIGSNMTAGKMLDVLMARLTQKIQEISLKRHDVDVASKSEQLDEAPILNHFLRLVVSKKIDKDEFMGQYGVKVRLLAFIIRFVFSVAYNR